jgi:hypothetical protein
VKEGVVCELLNQRSIFVLPYKAATQSGVLYTLLAYRVVFISSLAGENAFFLKENELSELIFDRRKPEDILRAYSFAKENYDSIAEKLDKIAVNYEWENILTKNKVDCLYE